MARIMAQEALVRSKRGSTPSLAPAERLSIPPVGGVSVRVTPVDAVGLEARAAPSAGRSIKSESKLAALDLAIRCMDLTTLEGSDTPGKVRALCAKAVRPDPLDPTVPSVAAVCVYPTWCRWPPTPCAGTGVLVASVAGAFPPASARSKSGCDEIRRAVEEGADEIDIVLNRTAFLSGRLRHGLRRDRRLQGGLRPGPSQGHPRDRRVGELRPGPTGVDAGDGRRRRRHQDLHGQDRRGRDVAGRRCACPRPSATSTSRPAAWSA